MKVWVVTYPDSSGAPIVTVWANCEAATKHYEFLTKSQGGRVTIDEVPVYHVLEVTKNGKETD